MRTQKDNRRYKLHQHLKKAGRNYSAQDHAIYVSDFDNLSKWELELKNKFHYSIQLQILN